jgi:hypothetical protein
MAVRWRMGVPVGFCLGLTMAAAAAMGRRRFLAVLGRAFLAGL